MAKAISTVHEHVAAHGVISDPQCNLRDSSVATKTYNRMVSLYILNPRVGCNENRAPWIESYHTEWKTRIQCIEASGVMVVHST
jgi:hypothetical protein